jgi:hypothetical protein
MINLINLNDNPVKSIMTKVFKLWHIEEPNKDSTCDWLTSHLEPVKFYADSESGNLLGLNQYDKGRAGKTAKATSVGEPVEHLLNHLE